MRPYRILLLFAFLLISCASVPQPHEQDSSLMRASGPWAYFAGADGLAAVNLDSGELFQQGYINGLLPYTTVECAGGIKLLSYIGWDLRNGCVLIDDSGAVKSSFPEYSMHKLGDSALIGVRTREVLEGVAADTSVSLVKLLPRAAAVEMKNTLPLPPVGMLLDGNGGKLAKPTLLVTYEPFEALHDYNYPWAQSLKFTAVDENADILWTADVKTKKLVADLELVGNCNGVLLLSARYGYADGEYIGLDAGSGKLLWQVSSTIIMLAQDDYPYTDFIYMLPLELSGNTAWVPAYDSRYEEPGKCKIDLATGATWLDVDKAWVKRAKEEWKKRQQPAETPQSVEWKLGPREVLKLKNGKLSFQRGGVKVWERALVPHFGSGLELRQAGEKLLLLVETPEAAGGIGSQGLAHIVDRATGEEPFAGLEENAQLFQPLLIGGKVLLLDKQKTRLIQPPTKHAA